MAKLLCWAFSQFSVRGSGWAALNCNFFSKFPDATEILLLEASRKRQSVTQAVAYDRPTGSGAVFKPAQSCN